ncbi:MAG: alpha-galactosidase [Actinomycetota bacterium]
MSDLRLLRAGGVSLLVDVEGPRLPRVLHWGADLGPLGAGALADVAAALEAPVGGSTLDDAWTPTLLPTEDDGWAARPGVSGWGPGGASLRLRLVEDVRVTEAADGGIELRAVAADVEVGVQVVCELLLEPSGVVRARTTVTASGGNAYDLAGVVTLLPVPQRADEVLDLTGRWCRERSPQHSPLLHGGRTRESRRGRTGHDAPLLVVAGTAGFGFGDGEVWAAHVAWSGDHVHTVEKLQEGRTAVGGGELLRAGEVHLAPGESYVSPWVLLVWSDQGLDGLTDRLHTLQRARPGHPTSARPLVLNSWEAVYFDHDLPRLLRLVETAASVGVERFVLDDGWFLRRRDDSAGLGDWVVDPDVWPQGLHPLVDRLRELGLQVGLWFEPEMANLDSDLLREDPDRVLARPGRTPRPWRRQQVVDLTRPDVFARLLEQISAIVTEYDLDYLKWDHNRDLHEADHRQDGITRPAVHGQTLAIYRLLDGLRARHPGLEIESCASGGGRVDLGILGRTDRVWASDTNDAVERQLIQRWTGLLLAPELVGAHVGPPVAHTTGRTVDLGMRLLTALFGHAGIEWDITACTDDELERLRAWTALYRELRPLLHGGRTVRRDLPSGLPGSTGPCCTGWWPATATGLCTPSCG